MADREHARDAGPALPELFVTRFLDRLRSCDQPLIRLWSWPWSGRRRLLEGLARQSPDRWVLLPAHGALLDRLSRQSPSRPGAEWLVAEGRYRSAELLAAAGKLRPEQRLVLPVECRREDEVLPQRWLEPPAMRLRPAEIEQMFPGAGSERVEELARLTDGWIGPLCWLRDHGRGGEAPELAFAGDRFATRFHQRVTGRLDFGIFDVLLECSIDDELDAGLWRRVWIGEPQKLAALERLISEWRLVIGSGTARRGAAPESSLRLPRLIVRAARSRGLPAARRRELYSRLALGCHALGRAAEAERFLSLAGDAAQLRRLRALGVSPAAGGSPADESPATAPPAARVTPGRSGSPRLCLYLLGQPMVRRTDAEGSERDLDWRLRRAFLSLAFLALAPDRRATKEQLVDAIWRESSETSIAKNFHPTLSEARRTLGDRRAFTYNQGLYTLSSDLDWWIDCERFAERVRRGRELLDDGDAAPQRALEVWSEAWRLYRGELLAGLDADWIQPRRQALHHDYVELLRDVGDLCVRLGQLTRALDAFRSVLLEEPYEERIHLAVMELYARQGRRDLVRRQFVRMQELLIDELNVEPLEETQERYHQLMR